MAIDYDTNPTGVLYRAGKLIRYVNSRLAAAQAALPAELKAIADPYEASDLTAQVDGLYDAYAGFQANVVSERQALAAYVDATLTDRDTVLEQITVADVTGGSPGTVVPALHRQMVADGKTVNRSTVTVGAVAAAATNKGNGTVLASKLLDGFSAPLFGAPIVLEYAGLDSELAVPAETMLLVCAADSARDGLSEGTERFSWSGGISNGQRFDWQDEGSGAGPGLTAAGAATVVTGSAFETWSANVPAGWTVDAGTAGVHVLQEAGAGNVYRGLSAAKFAGDGVQATIQLGQAVATGAMGSRRLYLVAVRAKASAAAGTGTLTVQFTGTGYAAGATEKVSVLAGAMPVAWTLYSFFLVTPAVLPSDWRLTVANGGTPNAGSAVYVDDLFVAEGVYHGGVAAAVVPGAARFAVGDRFTFTVTNNGAGVIQEFFRKQYGVQLPSSGAPTISDALAT